MKYCLNAIHEIVLQCFFEIIFSRDAANKLINPVPS